MNNTMVFMFPLDKTINNANKQRERRPRPYRKRSGATSRLCLAHAHGEPVHVKNQYGQGARQHSLRTQRHPPHMVAKRLLVCTRGSLDVIPKNQIHQNPEQSWTNCAFVLFAARFLCYGLKRFGVGKELQNNTWIGIVIGKVRLTFPNI